MDDIQCHGTYINDRRTKRQVREVTETEALKLITQFAGIDTTDYDKNSSHFINKGWLCLFTDEAANKVTTVYKHDYTWWIYELDMEELKDLVAMKSALRGEHPLATWVRKYNKE